MKTNIAEIQAGIRRLDQKIKNITEGAEAADRNLTADEDEQVNAYLDQIEASKRQIDTASRISASLSGAPAPGDRIEVVDSPNGFHGLGELLQAAARTKFPAGSTLGGKPCGRIDPRLYGAATGLNEGLPADGGFLVGTEISNKLWERIYTSNAILSQVTRLPVGAGSNSISIPTIKESSRANGSRFGGVQSYWLPEAGSITPSKPVLAQLKFELKKLAALCYSTDEMLQDAALLEAVISRTVTSEFQFVLLDAILNGNGAGKPMGIMNSPALVTIAKETGQAADTIEFENISKMWAAMWAPSRPNSVWLINQELEPQLDALSLPVALGGIPAYLPPSGLAGSPYGTIKGRPVIPVEQAAALGDLGDVVLFDPTQYILAEKGGVQSASSMHVNFTTDEMCFRFILRVDGQPAWSSALTPFKGAQQQSPFITLAARS